MLVADRFDSNKIDLAVKQVFQCVQEAKVRIRLLTRRQRHKLDKKIDVAFGWIELARRCGAEHFQAADIILSAKTFQLGSVLFNDRQHGFLSTNSISRDPTAPM